MVENEKNSELGSFQTHETVADVAIEKALEKLSFDYYGERLFRAADPGYPQNFTRDSLISARLMADPVAARAQLKYSAMFQGESVDPHTGEEPGKIHHERHHELPIILRPNGLGTAYNACDTTALFLETIAELANGGDTEIVDELAVNIARATDYIVTHVKNGLFIEDPKFSGADKYGLRVTYWKDSVLNIPDRDEPVYPIVYTQPHFQNANALLQIGKITDNRPLVQFAEEMFAKGFEKLWTGDHFVTAIDSEGVIDSPSSDSLMTLLHIPRDLLPEGYAESVEQYMTALESPAGYLSGIKVGESPENSESSGLAGINDDEYHTKYLWTHEQGLLHMAAARHNMQRSMVISERVIKFIDAQAGVFPELLEYNDSQNTYVPAGPNSLQLWCVAMYKYFMPKSPAVLRQEK